MSEDSLLALREEFPTLKNAVHLIAHSLGAMPKGARSSMSQMLDEWTEDSIAAWGKWLPQVRALSDTIGKVLGVPSGTTILLPNVSIVQAQVASCFTFNEKKGRFAGKNRIVYDDLNFSTVHYVWQEQERRGAEIVVVKSKDGIRPPMEELLKAIDERTLIVPISHVLFRSSAMYDVRPIVKRAHEVGALVMLDCYQSAGTIPLEIEKWDVDMACGGSVKWACGGPGAAYLYVKKDLVKELSPMSAGWFAHAEPFAFDMGPMRFAEDAWRFIGGTMAIPAVYAARPGWDLLARAGVENIRAKSLRQTRLLRDLVKERGFHVNTPDEDAARGGTICFDFDGAEPVSRELVARRFFHDFRPKCGLRVSPHYYTTDDELRAFMSELDAIRKNGPRPSSPARAY